MVATYFLYCFVFLLGLCIGSFLNCFVYRLEHKKSIMGRSFCPHCKHTLSWLDLFPVFSFLCLAGKCRYCKKKISWQYPLVEFITATLFVLIAAIYGFDLLKLCFLFYIACALIIIFVYDLRHYIIPDRVLLPAIIISLLYRLAQVFNHGYILNYIFAAIFASGFFGLIYFLSKGRWMGFGDVKLAILLGLLLGWPAIVVGLFLSFLFGAVIGLTLMGLKKKGLKSEIPFGPFLITGTFVAMLWGSQIISWYFNLFLF